jgi:ribosomal protein S18 acetylase RimI-like enzyme
MSELRIRAMDASDLPAASAVSAAAFDVKLDDESPERRWRERIAYPLVLDPDGAAVAERDGRIIGVAQAMRRERLWCLSLLTVEPGLQSAGAGRALLEWTLRYGEETDAGLIVSSNDPRALRLYALAGFSLLPTLQAEGAVDRRAFPLAGVHGVSVREGDRADIEALAAISREVRGAPHTAELEYALDDGGRLLCVADRGFAVVQPGQNVWLLLARDDAAATALLWAALELVGEADRPIVRWLTGEQQWAIDVLVRAGLRLEAYGALCVRGEPGTLRPFIPSGPFA